MSLNKLSESTFFRKNVLTPPLAFGLMAVAMVFLIGQSSVQAGPREQAKRIHERLAGVAPSETVLNEMQAQIVAGNSIDAAMMAMENSHFYSISLKNFITPWTNEEASPYEPLNDYSATVIGMIRDDMDFREILSGDILYVADSALGLPSYSNSNNNMYQALEDQSIDLQANLVQTTQSAVTGLPAEATAGVTTSRAAAKSFFIDGTNRAMFRFTLINQLCTDLEPLSDITRSPDRIRQDVSRSPGGDSRIYMNNCVGCHTGMDPLSQAYAYYEFDYNTANDPNGDNGSLTYNTVGVIDPDTGSRVTRKHQINANNFKFGFIYENDNWDNYWRAGQNANLGWSSSLSGSGQGAKSMGEELANSDAFASCQVEKVFKQVCLRSAVDATDRNQLDSMVTSFKSNSYNLKQVFAESAAYCMGD